jgi:hypothetical protein
MLRDLVLLRIHQRIDLATWLPSIALRISPFWNQKTLLHSNVHRYSIIGLLRTGLQVGLGDAPAHFHVNEKFLDMRGCKLQRTHILSS